jgi:quercetin dioxygenase-like cupin family protein
VSDSYFSKDAAIAGGALRVERGGEMKGIEVAPGVTLHPLIGDGMNINIVVLEPGAEAELHAHSEEQMGYIVSGDCEFTDGTNTWKLAPGDTYHAGSGVPHGAKAFDERCVIIDCFSPMRAGIKELLEGA